MLRKLRRSRFTPWLAWVAVGTTGAGPLIPAQASPSKPSSRYELPGGRTQRLTEQERRSLGMDAAPTPDARPLTMAEMERLRGAGYRDERLAGTMPWHRSFRDVNLCTGNLFKNFTDIQVAPARGAGLVLNRSYNSLDPRCGPFGIGWTHAYDIHMKEDVPDPDGTEYAIRKDFFGGAHRYRRDADGLYTPPPYLYDELSSEYHATLINGGPISDRDVSIDGTVKHFFKNGDERSCDWIEDRHGNRTTLTYGAEVIIGGVTKKLLTSVTDPSGRSLTFTWTNLGTPQQPVMRITLVQGPMHAVAYEYDGSGQLWKVRLDPNGLNRTTVYGYAVVNNEVGLLASITDPLGAAVTFTYAIGPSPWTPTVGVLWAVAGSEPAGIDPQTQQQRQLSWSIGVADPTQGPVSYPLQVGAGIVNGPGGMYAVVDWGARITELYMQSLHYCWTYDTSTWNVLAASSSSGFAGGYNGPCFIPNRVDGFTYGQHGNVLTHSVNGVLAETTEYWDGSRYFQKKRVLDALGNESTFDYHPRSAAAGERGNMIWARDARYAQTGEEYSYTYNQYGQKTSETNLNNVVTTFAYGDAWGNLTQVAQDPTGVNRVTAMSYDVAGRVLTSTDPNGRTATFSYNNLGQPLTAEFPATQDTPSEEVAYAYGPNGRLLTVEDNRGVTTLAYEPNGDRVASVTDPVTGAVAYTYEVTGERRTMTLAGGGTWLYEYAEYPILPKDDPNGIARCLARITDDQNRVVEYAIDYRGILCSTKWNQVFDGSGLYSYCRTDLTADLNGQNQSHGWLAETTSTYWVRSYPGGPFVLTRNLSQNTYSYNAGGIRTANAVSLYSQPNRAEQYAYDALNRLTAVDYGDGVTQGYSFDNMGNRLTKTEGGTTETYGYNAANMLVSRNGQAYVNDANGNTLSGGGRTNTWDSQNRLVQCVSGGNTSQYVYGADGLRRTSIVNGNPVHYALDSGMMVRELRAEGQELRASATYLLGPRGPEYRRDDQTQAIRWYLYDGLGSVLGEVDPSGNLTASRKYDVYGLVRAGDNGTSRHKFVGSLGHTSEDETGLIYMRARWMDPALGRFISEDPARDGANWFEYCRGNPVNAVDPSGEAPEWPDYQQFLHGLGWVLVVGAFLAAQRQHFLVSQYLANGAIISFGLSAAGMLEHDLDVLSQSISTLLPVVTTMIAGAYASARASMPFTRALSITAFGYGLLVLGFVLATDPDL